MVAVLFHPTADLEEWVDDWNTQEIEIIATGEWLADWQQMAERHGCFFHGRCYRPGRSARPSIPYKGSVEQWLPLVMSYFSGADVDIAMRIISCESRGNPNAKNRSSTAAGLWQFLRSTWDRAARATGSPSYSAGGPYDPVWATINAAWLRARGSGWNQWECY